MKTLETGPGRHIAYWEAGSGPALVFIHGVGTSGAIWRDDLAELADSCRLIVYDRRGYGESSESPRSWREHTDDAIALIEALDAAPAIVAGYSGGSIVALDLVVRRPELVSSLVLLDPAFNLRRCRTPGFVKAFVTAMAVRRFRGDRAGAERWMRYVTSYSTGGSAWDKAPPERRERLLANAGGIFADAASGGGEHVDESQFAGLRQPVTIVDAALSPPFLRRSCKRLHQLMPQARTVTFEHSGHHLVLDARDELLDVLRAAVRRAEPTATAS